MTFHDRRSRLVLWAVIAGIVPGQTLAQDNDVNSGGKMDLRTITTVRNSARSFVTPEVRSSGDKALDTTIVVQFAKNRIGDHWVRMRSYDGRLTGPTLRARPGDKLSILLVNDLPNDGAGDAHDNVPHAFNNTNLHTHGLHVSPNDYSDNVSIDIRPGGRVRYNIQIPDDHPCGTFWYHAHRHGSVAVQLASGMAGLLIVEGGKVGNLDRVKEIKAAEEKVFVFQQIPYRFTSEMVGEIFKEDVYKAKRSDEVNQETTINGVPAPVLAVQTGTVQRWRMLHAGLGESLNLMVVRDNPDKEEPLEEMPHVPLYEIAADGLAMKKMTPRGTGEDNRLLLQPGYRSDVLVHFDQPGNYLLVSGKLEATKSFRQVKQEPKYLAKIVVRGADLGMKLPSDPNEIGMHAPFKSIDKDEVMGRVRKVEFSIEFPQFLINGKSFNPKDVKDYQLELGAAEEWLLSSGGDIHPFHIHVNPFEVILKEDSNGKVLESVWRDTIVVTDDNPAESPIKIRMRFTDYPGKTVFHCHNLRHEDQGMMAAIELVDPKKTPAAKPQAGVLIPAAAPDWSLLDAGGKRHRAADLAGRDALLVFFRGAGCSHCMAQISQLARRKSELDQFGLRVLAICPDSVEDLKEFRKEGPDIPFTVLADPAKAAFRQFGCDGQPVSHGAFLIDSTGQIYWRHVADQPLADINQIFAALARSRDRVRLNQKTQ